MDQKPIKVALAGNPNVGKTTLFNELTGENLHVGNWPGVTVEKVIGKKVHKGRKIEIVDLPGTYSLTAYSKDELITRNYIVEEEPDIVLNIIDPTNLGRNLYLTYQLMELQCQMLLAVNMWDLTKDPENAVDIRALSRELDMEVIPTTSTTGKGVKELLDAIVRVAGSNPTCKKQLRFIDDIERKINE